MHKYVFFNNLKVKEKIKSSKQKHYAFKESRNEKKYVLLGHPPIHKFQVLIFFGYQK